MFIMPGLLASLVAWTSAIAGDAGVGANLASPVQSVSCIAIRDHPGSPTYGFRLQRRRFATYEAQFLSYSGNESRPPQVVVSIPNLFCRFRSNDRRFFQCEKQGGSVETVQVIERKLSLVADKLLAYGFIEFRAVGVAVPGDEVVYRFTASDRCRVIRQ